MSELIIRPQLNVPQAQFLELPHKFRLFVGGFGSGKTWTGAAAQMKHFWQHPGHNLGYFAPTYAQIRDIYWPTFEEVSEAWGLRCEIQAGNREIHVYSGRVYRGTVICRSMDNPGSIVGFKIARGMVDELDVMDTRKAEHAWRKIIARLRLRYSGANGIDVTTTPEGFKFVYQQWVEQVAKDPEVAQLYGLVRASTYDNEANLPDDYIDSLRKSYPAQLIRAYLRGQFVNLTSGSVYPEFCRKRNGTTDVHQPGEALHIGMDFNVQNMTAIVSVIRNGLPITTTELTKIRDTPTMAAKLRERFGGQHPMVIYPDASGGNTSSKNASESDLSILRQAGLTVSEERRNPAVKDRVNAVNAMILNAKLERRWKINVDNCPELVKALEQQPYDNNGDPDKSSGLDHPPDAVGYFINKRWPIERPVVQHTILRV